MIELGTSAGLSWADLKVRIRAAADVISIHGQGCGAAAF